MRWIPRRYQITAINFLMRHKHGALFLDPGLGKTSITLFVIRLLLLLGKTKGVLIIAPLRPCYSTWPNETKKWPQFNKITHTILHGKGRNFDGPKTDLYFMNPEGLEWFVGEAARILKSGGKLPFDTLLIDESSVHFHKEPMSHP